MFDKLICVISIICLAMVLVLVLVLKDSLRTYFKSLSLSWSLGVRSLSLGVRSRRSLSWSLGVRSLSLSWSLGVRSLLTSLCQCNFYDPVTDNSLPPKVLWPRSRQDCMRCSRIIRNGYRINRRQNDGDRQTDTDRERQSQNEINRYGEPGIK